MGLTFAVDAWRTDPTSFAEVAASMPAVGTDAVLCAEFVVAPSFEGRVDLAAVHARGMGRVEAVLRAHIHVSLYGWMHG